jgi:hypothetical protein
MLKDVAVIAAFTALAFYCFPTAGTQIVVIALASLGACLAGRLIRGRR